MCGKKLLMLAMAVICFTACGNGNNIDGEGIIDNVTVTAPIIIEETKETSSETTIVFPAEEMTNAEKYFDGLECEYDEHQHWLQIWCNKLDEFPEFDPDNKYMDDVNSLRIIYGKDVDLDVIKMFPNLTSIEFYYCTNVDIDEFIEITKDLPLERIQIGSDTYTPAKAEKLIMAFPNSLVSFEMFDETNNFQAEEPLEIPELDFITMPTIKLTDTPAEWEQNSYSDELTSEDFQELERYSDSIVTAIVNHSDEVRTIDSVRIFRTYDEDEPVLFNDGTDSIVLDLEVDPKTRVDFCVSHDILDYSALEAGTYELCFEYEDGVKECPFFIDDGADPNFFTDEQKLAFDKACEYRRDYFGTSTYLDAETIASTTAEDFVQQFCDAFTYDYAYSLCDGKYLDENGNLREIMADRGGHIAYNNHYFLPLYKDDETIIFQNIITYNNWMAYGNTCTPWFETINYRMVKTEDGWRFDNFRLWF